MYNSLFTLGRDKFAFESAAPTEYTQTHIYLPRMTANIVRVKRKQGIVYSRHLIKCVRDRMCINFWRGPLNRIFNNITFDWNYCLRLIGIRVVARSLC